MKRLIVALSIVAVLPLAISSCGGSEVSTGNPSSGPVRMVALTKEEYVERANQVCRQGYKDIGKVLAGVVETGLSDEEKERFMVDQAMPPFKRMVNRLRSLGAPRGDEEKVEAVLVAYEKGIREVEENPSRAISGKLPFDKGQNTAYRYGLTVCAGLG